MSRHIYKYIGASSDYFTWGECYIFDNYRYWIENDDTMRPHSVSSEFLEARFEHVEDLDTTKYISTSSSKEDTHKAKRYNSKGNLECIDVIRDQQMDFIEGSILKYLWRYKEKGGALDLKKAIEYLNMKIEELETSKLTPKEE